MHYLNTLLLCVLALAACALFITYSIKGCIMATAQQLATRINAAAERADKAKTEIIAAIDDLKAQIVASEVSSPELDAAVSRLEGTVQALDDLNPDGATPAPVQG